MVAFYLAMRSGLDESVCAIFTYTGPILVISCRISVLIFCILYPNRCDMNLTGAKIILSSNIQELVKGLA
jgi:hypothetical protein